MQYTLQIDIDKPLDEVITLFDDPENMKHWQPGLVSYEQLSANPRQKGAQMKLRYRMGKREMEMTETIVELDLPRVFSATYECGGVWNQVDNRFEALDDNTTRWTTENEFRLSGFYRIMGFLFPGMFKKESLKYLKQFKAFAEGQ